MNETGSGPGPPAPKSGSTLNVPVSIPFVGSGITIGVLAP
jgi:hypothetical protein